MSTNSGAVVRRYHDSPKPRSAGARSHDKHKQWSTPHTAASLMAARQARKSQSTQVQKPVASADLNPFDCLAATESSESSAAQDGQPSYLTEASFRWWANEYRAADASRRDIARYWGDSYLRRRKSPHPELPARTPEGGWILYSHNFQYVFALTGDISYSAIGQSSDAGEQVAYHNLPKSITRQDTSFYGLWRLEVRRHQRMRRTAEGLKQGRTERHTDVYAECSQIGREYYKTIFERPASRYTSDDRSRVAISPYRAGQFAWRETFRRQSSESRERLQYGTSKIDERRRVATRPYRPSPFTPIAYTYYSSGATYPSVYEYVYRGPFTPREEQAIRLWKKPERRPRQLETTGHSEDYVTVKESRTIDVKNYTLGEVRSRQKRASSGSLQNPQWDSSATQTSAQREKLLAYIGAVSYPRLCGPQGLSAWRRDAGRKKEWRNCGKITSKPRRATEGLRTDKHRGFRELLQRQDYSWMATPFDIDDETIYDSRMTQDWMPEHAAEEAEDVVPKISRHKGHTQIELPNASFTGAVIGSLYRLTRHLRSDDHGDIFAAEDLSTTSHRYEVKAFKFQGITRGLHDYRRRNLKKITKSANYVHSIKHGSKIYAITRVSDSMQQTTSASSRQRGGIGAIGRRNTPEFNAAFPPLPGKTVIPNPSSLPTPVQLSTRKYDSGRLWIFLDVPSDDVKRITSKTSRTFAQSITLQQWQDIQAVHAQQKTKISLATLHADQSEVSPKNPKTDQQLERRRVKQREWRARKRARKLECASPVTAKAPREPQATASSLMKSLKESLITQDPSILKMSYTRPDQERRPTPPPESRTELRLSLTPFPDEESPKPRVRLPATQPPEAQTSEDKPNAKAKPTAPLLPVRSDSELYATDMPKIGSTDHIMQTIADIRELLDAQRKIMNGAKAKTEARRERYTRLDAERPRRVAVPDAIAHREAAAHRKVALRSADDSGSNAQYLRPTGMPWAMDDDTRTQLSRHWLRDVAVSEQGEGGGTRATSSSPAELAGSGRVDSSYSIVPKAIRNSQNDAPWNSRSMPVRPKNPLHKELRYRTEIQKRGFFLSGSDFFDK